MRQVSAPGERIGGVRTPRRRPRPASAPRECAPCGPAPSASGSFPSAGPGQLPTAGKESGAGPGAPSRARSGERWLWPAPQCFSFREARGPSPPAPHTSPCPDPGRPAPPPPAGPAAAQWAILRAPDAHGTAGDEGIRASPSLALLPRVGLGREDIWPRAGQGCLPRVRGSLPPLESTGWKLHPSTSPPTSWHQAGTSTSPREPAVGALWPQALKAGEQEAAGTEHS